MTSDSASWQLNPGLQVPTCLAQRHDVALLDLDGVVYVGPAAVPHASTALAEALARHGMRSAFVTNNAARPPAAVAEHLEQLGVRAQPADVVTSAQAGARVLAGLLQPGDRVLVIGGPGVAAALRERGLEPVASDDDEPVAVLQGYGPGVGWSDLAEGCLAIGRGCTWVATNMDITIPTSRGRVLGNGSLVTAVTRATGVTPLVAGKPEPPLMMESVERAHAERPLVVGDRLDTDIEGAWRAGIPSLLVLTGVTDWQDVIGVEPAHRPTYIGRDLRDLLVLLPEVSARVGTNHAEASCGLVTMQADIRRPEGAAASTVPAQAADGDRLAWLPERIRTAGRGPSGDLDELDMDVVRAAAALAWAVDDAGAVISSAARLGPTP